MSAGPTQGSFLKWQLCMYGMCGQGVIVLCRASIWDSLILRSQQQRYFTYLGKRALKPPNFGAWTNRSYLGRVIQSENLSNKNIFKLSFSFVSESCTDRVRWVRVESAVLSSCDVIVCVSAPRWRLIVCVRGMRGAGRGARPPLEGAMWLLALLLLAHLPPPGESTLSYFWQFTCGVIYKVLRLVPIWRKLLIIQILSRVTLQWSVIYYILLQWHKNSCRGTTHR